jgi:class 3 adenylate cyclase
LLNALGESDVVRRIKDDELICLLTGDGLFAAFRNVENRHAPLRLALSIREIFGHLRAYRLRFGVNSGPASLIQLSNGSQQLIAHAINWTARVMAAATDNVVLLSEHYYEENVRSASDQFPGYAFERVPDLVTKKGEPVPAYKASRA